MAFYRKKHRKPGPSKNEEKVRRAQEAREEEQAAGTLGGRFPAVRSLRVKLAVTTPQGVVLQESERSYGAQDAFVFEAACPGSCGSGRYDFAELIAQALQAAERKGAAQIVCAEASYNAGSGGNCGCVAKCEFESA